MRLPAWTRSIERLAVSELNSVFPFLLSPRSTSGSIRNGLQPYNDEEQTVSHRNGTFSPKQFGRSASFAALGAVPARIWLGAHHYHRALEVLRRDARSDAAGAGQPRVARHSDQSHSPKASAASGRHRGACTLLAVQSARSAHRA